MWSAGAPSYQERFSAVTQQKDFDASPNWDKSSNGCCEELKTKFVIERTIARAQHRIVRSSKSSACLGVQKAHTHQNLAEQIYWWFMLTHTHEGNAFLLLVSVRTFFLQICENLLLQICENFITLALFVRPAISLLVRIAFLQIHGRNIPFFESTNAGGVKIALNAEQRMAGVETLLWVLNIWID